MECPFVFSSLAEIPVFCPREQCPLHVFSLEVVSPERTPAGISIAWRFSGNSTKVTVFPKNTWTDTPLSSFPLPFICPFLYLVIFYFIYLFFFHSFTVLLFSYACFINPWSPGGSFTVQRMATSSRILIFIQLLPLHGVFFGKVITDMNGLTHTENKNN